MNGFRLIIKHDEEDGEAAEVLVDGLLENRSYRFLLDTGAAKTHVLYDDYTAHLNPAGQDETSSVFGEGVQTLVSVPRVKLGSIVKEDFTVARAAKGSPFAHNLIGMDLLKDFCCHFRFDEGEVLIGPAEENRDFQTLFLDERFHPYVDVRFGKVNAKAVWDTGAGVTAAHIGFIEAQPALFEQVGETSGTDGSGISMITPVFRMAEATIGGRAFSSHKVVGIDLSRVNETLEVPMDLLLGYSTLSQANWLFDFPAKRWAVTKLLSA